MDYFLRRIAVKPANAEPNNQAAAGTGTALTLSILTLSKPTSPPVFVPTKTTLK